MHIKPKIAFASVVVSGLGFLLLLTRFPEVFSHHSENWAPLFVILAGFWLAAFQAILMGIAFYCSRDVADNNKRSLRWAAIGFLLGTLCLMLATYIFTELYH